MLKVLILNHPEKQCGVHQFGKHVYDIAKQSDKVTYVYSEISGVVEWNNAINIEAPDYIIYNFYPCTMGWLGDDIVINNKERVRGQFFIFHDGFIKPYPVYDKYLFFGATEKDEKVPGGTVRVSADRKVLLPRPLYDYKNSYKKNDVPTIGSFGFGGEHKGFNLLIDLINKEFDRAVINIHMPNAFFGDRDKKVTAGIIEACKRLNINPNIQLNITTEFLSDSELLDFLAKNDLNAFLYHAENEGLSSVIDWALSVQRPIAISDNMMFRHIANDLITVEKNSLKEILSRGTKPLKPYYKMWSRKRFIAELDSFILGEHRA